MNAATIENSVFDTIREFNRQQPPNQQIGFEPESVLLGDGGVLDSLGVINLIVAIEQNLRTSMGAQVDLLSEAVGDSGAEKLASIGALAREIHRQLGIET